MKFLNEYQDLKNGLEQRKSTVKESLQTEKSNKNNFITQIDAKKSEYSQTLDTNLLNEISMLEAQIVETDKRINQLNGILEQMNLEKAIYNGDINQDFKEYVNSTDLKPLLDALVEAKTDYITALKQVSNCMNDIYNTSTEAKRKATEILKDDIIKAIAFNSPIGYSDLQSHIITENKADMVELNQAYKHLRALTTRI